MHRSFLFIIVDPDRSLAIPIDLASIPVVDICVDPMVQSASAAGVRPRVVNTVAFGTFWIGSLTCLTSSISYFGWWWRW